VRRRPPPLPGCARRALDVEASCFDDPDAAVAKPTLEHRGVEFGMELHGERAAVHERLTGRSATPSGTTTAGTSSATPTRSRCCGSSGRTPSARWDWDSSTTGTFHGNVLRTNVNGEVKQEASTDEMAWDMHYLVADIARTITLYPEDVCYPALLPTPGPSIRAMSSSRGRRLGAPGEPHRRWSGANTRRPAAHSP
jgi:Fumarylacetoacetate (FAA) hydrolase family